MRHHWRLDTKAWRHDFWEKSVPWVIGICFLIIMVALPTIVIQQHENNRSQNLHHASSIRKDNTLLQKDNEIKALVREVRAAQESGHQSLDEIAALQKEVATVIQGLPAADAALGTFAVWIEGCLSTGNCSNPPAMNGASK